MTRGAPIEKPVKVAPTAPVEPVDPMEPAAPVEPAAPAVRFAPSPNGRLHLGHAYSALFCFHVAQALGARFVLRIEDIDQARARPEFVEAIMDDLAWLGLAWETPVRRQSDHLEDYEKALGKLAHAGLLYESGATRALIQAWTAEMTAAGTAPARDPDGAPLLHRTLLEHPGQPAARRLDMAMALKTTPALTFCEIGPDCPANPVTARPALWGDAVIARKDIATSYHLAVVVDDALQGITHVTRGEDLFAATHLHRLLQWHLGLPAPVYCHHGLVLDEAGNKLSKSDKATSLGALRAAGATPQSIRQRVGIDRLAPYFDRLATFNPATRPPPPAGPEELKS